MLEFAAARVVTTTPEPTEAVRTRRENFRNNTLSYLRSVWTLRLWKFDERYPINNSRINAFPRGNGSFRYRFAFPSRPKETALVPNERSFAWKPGTFPRCIGSLDSLTRRLHARIKHVLNAVEISLNSWGEKNVVQELSKKGFKKESIEARLLRNLFSILPGRFRLVARLNRLYVAATAAVKHSLAFMDGISSKVIRVLPRMERIANLWITFHHSV